MLLPDVILSQCGPPHYSSNNGEITQQATSSEVHCVYTIQSNNPLPVIVPQINIPAAQCHPNNSLTFYDGSDAGMEGVS